VSVRAEPEERPGTGEDGPDQGRIPFRLRIGVTGHRKLPEVDELRKAVNDAIDLAISESGYPEGRLPNTPVRLIVVSALAEGADRLVVKEVLDRRKGSKLVCVLPVAEDHLQVYRDDFTSADSQQEFDHLLAGAWQRLYLPPEIIVPPDATQKQREAGYLWAGKEVVRNSDVLIALWDGQPSRGAGGTADLIRWMRERDVGRSEPSAAIRQGPARRILASALLGPPAADEAVFDVPGPLRIIVSTTADHEPAVDDGQPWDAAAVAVRERLRGDLAGLDEFNRKSFEKADWDRSAEQTMNDLAPARYRHWPRLNGILEQITPHLNRADQAAMAAQQKFVRSSYALFGCTALATIVAALQAVVFPGLWELTIGELALIIASVVIVAAEKRWKNNNKHWFVYRFLAERLRTACYLLAVGSPPETEFDVGGTPEEPMQNEWVRRAFTAVLAEGDLRQKETPEDPETLSSLIRKHWMGGQMTYFERTSQKLMRKHQALRKLLYGVLGATIVAAALHSLRIWPFHSGDTQALVMCAIGLPAAAGALSNARSLREFSRHSFRYARMAAILRRYMGKFDDESGIDDIRRLAEDVGSLLTAETRGWLVEVSAQGLEIHG
jgi:hypothetical protein